MLNKEFKVESLVVRVYDGRSEMGMEAANVVAEKIRQLLSEKDSINMIFAAAPSQNEFLWSLREKDLAWDRINAFHMDEYIGLPSNAPQLFGNFLREAIFDKVSFKSVHYLDGNAADIESEIRRYSELLAAYPVDIVCMGIGENGHLAFNDPPVADFNDPHLVKKVELDDACRTQQVNDGCFDKKDEVPTHAITLTIPALMNANSAYVIVPGSKKAMAVHDTIYEPLVEAFPSSILRKHPHATMFLDADSVSGIDDLEVL